MISETLFEEIVAEVMRRLEKKLQGRKRALVLFTGGHIALSEALAQVRLLRDAGWEILPVLSAAAQDVIGASRILEDLEVPQVLTGENSPPPSTLLEGTDLVLVPILTMNTAVKVALGLADTFVTTLISGAIMMGKPIIAARNAADPSSPERRELGMDRAPVPWVRMLEEYFNRLESFGIRLVDVRELAEAASRERGKGPEMFQRTQGVSRTAKRVVTRADVIRAWEEGRDLTVAEGTIITPLAQEVAGEYGVELLRGD